MEVELRTALARELLLGSLVQGLLHLVMRSVPVLALLRMVAVVIAGDQVRRLLPGELLRPPLAQAETTLGATLLELQPPLELTMPLHRAVVLERLLLVL